MKLKKTWIVVIGVLCLSAGLFVACDKQENDLANSLLTKAKKTEVEQIFNAKKVKNELDMFPKGDSDPVRDLSDIQVDYYLVLLSKESAEKREGLNQEQSVEYYTSLTKAMVKVTERETGMKYQQLDELTFKELGEKDEGIFDKIIEEMRKSELSSGVRNHLEENMISSQKEKIFISYCSTCP